MSESHLPISLNFNVIFFKLEKEILFIFIFLTLQYCIGFAILILKPSQSRVGLLPNQLSQLSEMDFSFAKVPRVCYSGCQDH